MLKVFDIQDEKIKRIKNIDTNYMVINSNVLDMPYKDMYQYVQHMCERLETGGGFLVVNVDILGEANREDVEDIYNVFEDVLTSVFCTEELNKEKCERLGLYGLPNINMKTANLLKWLRYNSEIKYLALTVGKKDGFWKKRLVK